MDKLKTQRLRVLIAALSLVLVLPVHADGHSEQQYDMIQLNASSEIEVVNDLMLVNLTAQDTGADAAELSNKINATMGWALAKLKQYPAIDTRTRDYQTYPQYERNGTKIKGWVASQSIELKSDNFEQAGKAIQVLQERMQVQGMQLVAKPETRKRTEDQLINSALNAFKARALLVQTNMGAPGYRVVNLAIHTQGGRSFHRVAEQRGGISSMSDTSAPAIEAGTSTVSVLVDGRIQLE